MVSVAFISCEEMLTGANRLWFTSIVVGEVDNC